SLRSCLLWENDQIPREKAHGQGHAIFLVGFYLAAYPLWLVRPCYDYTLAGGEAVCGKSDWHPASIAVYLYADAKIQGLLRHETQGRCLFHLFPLSTIKTS